MRAFIARRAEGNGLVEQHHPEKVLQAEIGVSRSSTNVRQSV
jgi:hypothetical protein